MTAGQNINGNETVRLVYRCKLCGGRFDKRVDAPGLPENTLRLMQRVGLTKHNCRSGDIGIAELEGYNINE